MLWEGSGLSDVVGRYLEESEMEVDGIANGNGNGNGNGNAVPENGGDADTDEKIQRQKKRSENAKELFGGEPLGLNPNIRIYRYSKGQFFAKHCECCQLTSI